MCLWCPHQWSLDSSDGFVSEWKWPWLHIAITWETFKIPQDAHAALHGNAKMRLGPGYEHQGF